MSIYGERPKSWTGEFTPPETTNGEDSMNAISFGFAATAILVSMFLIMAIFEHLIRPRASNSQSQSVQDLEPGQPHIRISSLEKLEHLPIVGTPQPSNCSVLMPGQRYPTYLAQPAPLPCPREGIHWPSHDNCPFPST